MKLLVAFSIVLAFLGQTLTKVGRINQYLEEAQAAYARQDYSTATYLYQYLNDSLQVRDREVKINLAHAYFQRQNSRQALRYYQPLLTKTPPRISSLINLQLGVMSAPEDKNKALNYFKKALILNPMNEEARYNYEILKKYLLQHPEENQQALPPPEQESAKPENPKPEQAPSTGQKEDPQGTIQAEITDWNNADPQNTPEPNSNNNDAEDSKTNSGSRENLTEKSNLNLQRKEFSGTLPGTERGLSPTGNKGNDRDKGNGGREDSDSQDINRQTTYDQYKEASLTPEKAKMLLDAMRAAEVQYLQQIPRRSSHKSNSDKAYW